MTIAQVPKRLSFIGTDWIALIVYELIAIRIFFVLYQLFRCIISEIGFAELRRFPIAIAIRQISADKEVRRNAVAFCQLIVITQAIETFPIVQ